MKQIPTLNRLSYLLSPFIASESRFNYAVHPTIGRDPRTLRWRRMSGWGTEGRRGTWVHYGCSRKDCCRPPDRGLRCLGEVVNVRICFGNGCEDCILGMTEDCIMVMIVRIVFRLWLRIVFWLWLEIEFWIVFRLWLKVVFWLWLWGLYFGYCWKLHFGYDVEDCILVMTVRIVFWWCLDCEGSMDCCFLPSDLGGLYVWEWIKIMKNILVILHCEGCKDCIFKRIVVLGCILVISCLCGLYFGYGIKTEDCFLERSSWRGF